MTCLLETFSSSAFQNNRKGVGSSSARRRERDGPGERGGGLEEGRARRGGELGSHRERLRAAPGDPETRPMQSRGLGSRNAVRRTTVSAPAGRSAWVLGGLPAPAAGEGARRCSSESQSDPPPRPVPGRPPRSAPAARVPSTPRAGPHAASRLSVAALLSRSSSNSRSASAATPQSPSAAAILLPPLHRRGRDSAPRAPPLPPLRPMVRRARAESSFLKGQQGVGFVFLFKTI